uniref:Uncharacterized protein n=1 Tax=Sphenodon punctatus TaxID=8508 RepID=A0A8D0G9G2_SPHPU
MDDVEEMKLILHMWVALFYSKPYKSPTTRKVVEHSNPAKYVSINSTLDPLAFVDDCEGLYSSEKCLADSPSEALWASIGLEKKTSSTVEKPLSCNELSSTSCLEECSPSDDDESSSHLPLEDLQQAVAAEERADSVRSLSRVEEEGLEEESPLAPILPTDNSDCSFPDKHGDATMRQEELCTDNTTKDNQVLNLMEVSQNDTASAQAELPEDQENEQPVTSDKRETHVHEVELEEESPLAPIISTTKSDTSSPDKLGDATMRQEELCTDDTAKFNQVEEEQLEEESPLDPILPTNNLVSSSPDKHGDATMRQEQLNTAKANQVLNLMEVSQSDTTSAQAEFPEHQ